MAANQALLSVGMVVAVTALMAMVTISVFKPWGLRHREVGRACPNPGARAPDSSGSLVRNARRWHPDTLVVRKAVVRRCAR